MTATTWRRFCLTRKIPRRTARKSAYGGVDLWARLSRIWEKIALIAAVVFATCGSADAEVLEVRSGDAILGLDGATGAPVRFADPRAGLELASGGHNRPPSTLPP